MPEKRKPGKLFIMCPCYNEKEVLRDSAVKLKQTLDHLITENLIRPDSRIIFIDDGSKDNTWDIICELNEENNQFGGIKLAHNAGQQSALMCAYNYATDHADLCITLDVDLQDDISVIPEMVKDYLGGFEVVTTQRKSRKKDSFAKKSTAGLYYKIIKMMGTEMKPEQPEYRLLSKRALEALKGFNERNPYPRDLIPRLGFKSTTVMFDRQERMAGTTKYNYPKLIKLAITSIVRSSNALLMIPFIPMILALVGLFVRVKAEIYWFFLFASMGVFGYYLADIKDQVHGRPVYIIDKEI